MKTTNIAHAVAYCEVFMRSHDFGEYPELDVIYKGVHVLTADEVVNVIKECVRYSEVYGNGLILKEMGHPEFKEYICEHFKGKLRA